MGGLGQGFGVSGGGGCVVSVCDGGSGGREGCVCVWWGLGCRGGVCGQCV